MKKNQIMLTCSGIMLVLQSIAFYIVWSSGYSETMLRRMFLIAYIAALFMFLPVLGILLFLQFELALIELLIIILAIVVAVVDKKRSNI